MKPLRFWDRRREISGLLLVLKTSFVRAIAKRFIRGLPAAAQYDRTASPQAVRLAFHIYKFKIAFYNNGTIISDFNFCRRHFHSFIVDPLLFVITLLHREAGLNFSLSSFSFSTWAFSDRLHPTMPEFRPLS